MAFLSAQVPLLDECGSVYLAGAGPRAECLRLNKAGSRVWRTRVGSCDPDTLAGLPAADRAFLEMLLSRGVLAWSDLSDLSDPEVGR